MAAQSDPALDAFDRLRVREVKAMYGDIVSTFLARFKSTAARLEPDERIKLEVVCTSKSVELLQAVLSDPQADKICALHWEYHGTKDINSVISLLVKNCPELASLRVKFKHQSTFGVVSSLILRRGTKIKVLEMPPHSKGDLARFFAALGQSQVSALTLFSDGFSEFAQRLCDYLAKDLLVRMKVRMNHKQVPLEIMTSLAKCTRLAEFTLAECNFSQPSAFANFPKSITKLVLHECTFFGGFDWSLLEGSNVRELDFSVLRKVDGGQLGRALAVHLKAKGLEKLRFSDCPFVKKSLVAVGAELGRIKRLEIDGHLDGAFFVLISRVLRSPNSKLRELVLKDPNEMARSIENHLVPALRHPNCNLAKLRLSAKKGVERQFYHRLALFVLLQGQQVRRLYCPLRRLPVEMFRMVGKVL